MDITENVKMSEDVVAIRGSKSNLNEKVGGVRGFVTVIKNKGREDEQILCKNKENLLTDVGRDDIHNGMYTNAGSGQTAFNYMALSSEATAPTTSDTIISSEISSGGLERVQASTRSHIVGTNESTIEHQFTATTQHTDVRKSGIFDAISVGTLGHANTFTPASLEINDTLTVTWTITAG